MKIFKALRKKSVISKLNRINMTRCNHASVIMLFLAAALWLIDKTVLKSSMYLMDYWGYIAAESILSVLLIASTFFISRVKKKRMWYRIATDAYMAGMEINLFIMSGKALKDNNNATLYMMAVMFAVMVPVFYGIELYMALASQAVLMVIFMVSFFNKPLTVLTIITCQIVAVAVNYSKYDGVCNRILMEERLNSEIRVSEHDPMTGLLNRRGMDKRVKAIYPLCRRHKIPVGVIMLDIDEFKKYNDAFGHPQGDICIQRVSDVLRETAKRNTDVIARVGGEEFLIFVQEIRKEDLVLLASRIQQNVEDMEMKHAPGASHKNVTVSVGLAYINPRTGITFDDIYEEADEALYLAKKSGRNCVGMNKRIVYWNGNIPGQAIAK